MKISGKASISYSSFLKVIFRVSFLLQPINWFRTDSYCRDTLYIYLLKFRDWNPALVNSHKIRVQRRIRCIEAVWKSRSYLRGWTWCWLENVRFTLKMQWCETIGLKVERKKGKLLISVSYNSAILSMVNCNL